MCFPGMISMWGGAGDEVPPGWLLCDGSQVSQSKYPNLYQAIGQNFGQNPGEGVFYLPDLRGRFIRGVDNNAGRDPDVSSRTDMVNTNIPSKTVGSIQSHALQNHFHWGWGVGADPNRNLAYGEMTPAWVSGKYVDPTLTPVDCNASAESRPINAYLHFIIKCD